MISVALEGNEMSPLEADMVKFAVTAAGVFFILSSLLMVIRRNRRRR